MKTKRILSALLCCVMLFALLPTAALADAATSVQVGSVTLSNGEYTTDGTSKASGTPLPADGYAYFSVDSVSGAATLALKNLRNGTGPSGNRINAEGDLTIVLVDDSANEVTSTDGTAIDVAGNLTVSGSGSLTATSSQAHDARGIGVDGAIEITGGSVTGISNAATGSGHGVSCTGAVTVNGGSLTGTSKIDTGVVTKALTLSNSATLTGSSEKGGGVLCRGKLTVTGSTLTATGGTNSSANGLDIDGTGAIEITGGSVTGTSTTTEGNACGVDCVGAVTVSGGSLTGTSKTGNGVFATSTLTLSGSATLTGSSDKREGVSCSGKLTVSDTATLTATGGINDSAKGLNVSSSEGIAITGGSVTGISNAATGYGDGVYCAGAVTVSGGSLTGRSKTGNGVFTDSTLTLSNSATLTGSSEKGNGVQCNKKLTVSGTAVLNATGGTDNPANGLKVGSEGIEITGGSVTGTSITEKDYGRGVDCAGAVTVSGGSLTGTSKIDKGVFTASTLTLSGSATLTGTSDDSAGVYATGALTLSGSATLTGSSDTQLGVLCNGTLTVSDTAALTAAEGRGLQVDGNIVMTGGSVTGTNNTTSFTHGINCTGAAVTLSGGSRLTGTSKAGYGVNINTGDVTLSALTLSGSATLTGSSDLYDGVNCYGTVGVSGDAVLTATGGTAGSGLYADSTTTITGGTVTLSGAHGAIDSAPVLTGYSAAHAVTASPNVNGSDPVRYVEADIASYKYLRVAPVYDVSGTVKDSADALVDGATVTAGAKSTATDATGAYTLSLENGTHTIVASKDGLRGSVSVTVNGAAQTGKDITVVPLPSGYAAPVTVYNDPSIPRATIWLTGSGLPANDLLITDRLSSGSDYNDLLKLADAEDVFRVYNIRLQSGKSATGSAMYLHFDLDASYANQAFTLVHKLADGTYEYFYATADANGDLVFGPMDSLSPFMLVKGTLSRTAVVNVPQTGDSALPGLWMGMMLAAAGLIAGVMLVKRKRGGC